MNHYYPLFLNKLDHSLELLYRDSIPIVDSIVELLVIVSMFYALKIRRLGCANSATYFIHDMHCKSKGDSLTLPTLLFNLLVFQPTLWSLGEDLPVSTLTF